MFSKQIFQRFACLDEDLTKENLPSPKKMKNVHCLGQGIVPRFYVLR